MLFSLIPNFKSTKSQTSKAMQNTAGLQQKYTKSHQIRNGQRYHTFKNNHQKPLHFKGIGFLDQTRKNCGLLRPINNGKENSLHFYFERTAKVSFFGKKT
jgi:hypothetical protein